MRILALMLMAAALTACTTQAQLAEEEPIFRLQQRQIIERDLSSPLEREVQP